MKREWKIELVEIETDKVERTFAYQSEHLMLKAERGLLRQIDIGRFFTRLVEPSLQASEGGT